MELGPRSRSDGCQQGESVLAYHRWLDLAFFSLQFLRRALLVRLAASEYLRVETPKSLIEHEKSRAC